MDQLDAKGSTRAMKLREDWSKHNANYLNMRQRFLEVKERESLMDAYKKKDPKEEDDTSLLLKEHGVIQDSLRGMDQNIAQATAVRDSIQGQTDRLSASRGTLGR